MSGKNPGESFRLPEVEPRGMKVGVGVAGKASRLRFPPSWDHLVFFDDAQNMLTALRERRIAAAVRGELEAHSFLESVKAVTGARRLFRIALLSTARGTPFLFAPVGIDEGNDLRGQLELVKHGRSLLAELGWPDRVGVLAGGREEDRHRCAAVERSLRRSEEVASRTGARLRYILIEEAAERDHLIIAPDGISGNLAYRTLVHLGGGGSHGAVYFPMREVLVDTSRAGPPPEHAEAVKLALLLAARRGGARVAVPLK